MKPNPIAEALAGATEAVDFDALANRLARAVIADQPHASRLYRVRLVHLCLACIAADAGRTPDECFAWAGMLAEMVEARLPSDAV